MVSIEPVLLYRETAPRRRAFLITQANFSDIGQRCWDLTRLGGPKSESTGGTQSVGSSKPNRFPPGVPFKPLFQGQTYLLVQEVALFSSYFTLYFALAMPRTILVGKVTKRYLLIPQLRGLFPYR